MAVRARDAPAHGVGGAAREPLDPGDDLLSVARETRSPGQHPAVRRVYADRIGRHRHCRVEVEPDLLRRRGDARLRRGRGILQLGVRTGGRRDDECRHEHGGDHERASHRPPAVSERWPKIGATSRSAYRRTAMATNVSAKPAWNTALLGQSAWPSGKSAATMSVQPSAWWRNAARE